eukprot:c14907_g1_i1 orf=695-1246(-)
MACKLSQASGLLCGSGPLSPSSSTVSSGASLSLMPPPSFLRRSLVLSSSRRHLSSKVAQLSRRFVCRSSLGGASSALSPELKEAIDKYLTSNKVVLFMKGTKMFPQCGFSNTVVQVLNSLNVPYETVNILENEEMRSAMKIYSSWPTFPQVYIDGEFFGGCDITLEAFKNGQLQETIEKAMCS